MKIGKCHQGGRAVSCHIPVSGISTKFDDSPETQPPSKDFISSHRLNVICEIEARFFEKVLDRMKDDELNTFDLYQDLETLFMMHQMHMDSLSLVHKVRKKQKC